MKINIRDLEYFVAVADQKHFGKASQSVNVSQPTLSMQLKKMEERLGKKLIERLARHALPTELGKELLPIAREILRLTAEFESHCFNNDKRTRLKLGVIPTISAYLLPKITRGLTRSFTANKVSLQEAQTADLVRYLRDGTIDIAILSTPLREQGLEEIEIYSEPFFLAVGRSHPLAKRRRVHLKDIQDQNLLLLQEGHCMRNQALSLCKLSHMGDTDLSATSIETLRSMVAMQAGVTLIPQLAIRKDKQIAYIPFHEVTTQRNVGLIFRPSYDRVDLVREMAEVIKLAAESEKLKIIHK